MPFPVVLPALPDELLSSWLQRHANFYGVSGGRLLRHCGLDAVSLRSLDLTLTAYDQRRLAHALRSDQRVIRKMMQSCGRSRPDGLIATDRPMQVCKRCRGHHQAEPETRGARLRSWMEGWRLSCPLCGAPLVDSRPLNLLLRADPADPLLVQLAEHAAPDALRELMPLRLPGRTPLPGSIDGAAYSSAFDHAGKEDQLAVRQPLRGEGCFWSSRCT